MINLTALSISSTRPAICCGRTDGSIHICSLREAVRVGGGEGQKRTRAGGGAQIWCHRGKDLKMSTGPYIVRHAHAHMMGMGQNQMGNIVRGQLDEKYQML